MTAVGMGPVTLRRIQVLELRQRLERVSVDAFDDACSPAEKGVQREIKTRLLFLLDGHSTEADIAGVYALVQLGRQVYERTSEVMHGGLSMVNVPQVMVDEWRDIVDRLEALRVDADVA